MNKDTETLSQAERDKLTQAWSCLIDCVSHDLKTPLLSTRMSADILAKIIPDLIQGYKLAVANKLIEDKVSVHYLKAADEQIIHSLKNSLTNATNFLNLLHPLNQKLLSGSEEVKSVSIKKFLTQLIERYPFSHQNERNLLSLNLQPDFKVKFSETFLEPLLFNLLNNALRHISQEQKGEIFIWTEVQGNRHSLHFKDTAKGMDEDAVSCVFDRFFSLRDGKTVPGMGYCRLALLQLGGDILCHSIKGQFTHFTIIFSYGFPFSV